MAGTKNVQVVTGLTGEEVAALQNKICPEAGRLCMGRYDLLRAVHFSQPIGRRALADRLHLQERRVRSELALFGKEELLSVGGLGVELTPEGETALWRLRNTSGSCTASRAGRKTSAAITGCVRRSWCPATATRTLRSRRNWPA